MSCIYPASGVVSTNFDIGLLYTVLCIFTIVQQVLRLFKKFRFSVTQIQGNLGYRVLFQLKLKASSSVML
jgi:hypothetical protein